MALRLVEPCNAVPNDVRGVDVSRELRDAWLGASLDATWSFPDDWWTSAVDAVIEAVLETRDACAAAHQLGRDRAASGVSLAEAFDDLSALASALHDGAGDDAGPASAAIHSATFRALALGWADVTASAQTAGCCVDPLTGFTTPAYLRTRLGEIYSAAERDGADVGDRYALVVVLSAAHAGTRPGISESWHRSLLGSASAQIGMRETLRSVFSGGETTASTGPGVAVVLVARDAFLSTRHAALRSLLGAQSASDRNAAGATRTWIERLPRSLASARELIADLSR